MTPVEEIKKAIDICESNRNLTVKSSPIQIQIYSIFNRAKNQLKDLLTLVEDAQGTYNKEKK